MKDILLHLFTWVKKKTARIYGKVRNYPGAAKVVVRSVAGVLIGFILLFLLILAGVFGHIPGTEELRNINHQVGTEVYSADSVLLGRYFLQERSTVPSDQIPSGLKQALVATEDVRFYDHHGIDARSMLRVLVKGMVLQRESAGGGSTLTQQLAKNLYPRKSYGMFSLMINKVREMVMARRLESVYSKDEILVLYLNTVPFGDNVYGIKTAAERFFSLPVNQLTLDQSAVLIGMLKATHRYNPRVFPERAKRRRDVVLGQLEKYDFITAEARDSLASRPIVLNYRKTSHNEGLAPYYRDFIKTELLAWCRDHSKDDGTPHNLYTDGLKVYTTIDSRMQQYAEKAMRSQMAQLQEKFARYSDKSGLNVLANDKVKRLAGYQYLKRQGLAEKEIMKELKIPAPRKIFSWKGEIEKDISTYDSLVHHLQFLQAGLLAIEPKSGAVKAWVGGIDHQFFQYDHVRESTKRQVGSTFKPIVYSAALEQGISPCDYTSARKTSYTNMDDWTPENSAADSYDQKYSMEGALAGSVNTVSVKILEEAGISNTIATARRMGIRSELPAVPSLALGVASISVLEMVSAYAVFANEGAHVTPFFITSITNNQGVILDEFSSIPDPETALSKETSAMMLHMLKRVVNEGTGSGLRSKFGLANDLAGKTGTTQSNADGWFIGITPSLVIGCWVGADDPSIHFKTTAMGQGAATALPIVAGFLQQINKDGNFRAYTLAQFPPLTDQLSRQLDCDLSRSDRNLLQRIFNTKKGVKAKKFKE